MSVKINQDITVVQVEVAKNNVAIENQITQITVQTSSPEITIASAGVQGMKGEKGDKGELGADVIISETAPDIALDGKLWFNSTDGVLYVEYTDENGTYWIPTND
jgi:hypothetical protein